MNPRPDTPASRFALRPGTAKVLFLVGFIVLSYLFRYHQIIFFPPQGMHQFRQCDCLSFTLNYYQDQQPFAQPAMHNQIADGGESGLSAGEFPLLYYAVAEVWDVFGYHEWIYRIMVLLFTFIGFYALFRLVAHLLNDEFWGLVVSFSFLSSPVVIYYSANYLTNMPAFCLALTGWYFIVMYGKRNKFILFVAAMVLFGLAALFKVSSGISLMLTGCIIFLEWITPLRINGHDRLFRKPALQFVIFLATCLSVTAWYLYARYFNQVHGGAYTFNDLWPIWRMSSQEIWAVWEGFTTVMLGQMMNPFILMITGAMLLWTLTEALLGRMQWKWMIPAGILLFGTIAYTLMWFHAFGNHDYYLIDLLLFPIMVWILTLHLIQKFGSRKPLMFVFRILFTGLLLFNVAYGTQNIRLRYWIYAEPDTSLVSGFEVGGWAWMHSQYVNKYEAFTTIRPYLDALGINPNDRVISIPDESINITLALMNQKGWTSYGMDAGSSGQRIENLKKLGAKYLFVSDSSVLTDRSVHPYLENAVGIFGNIMIYDLRTNGTGDSMHTNP